MKLGTKSLSRTTQYPRNQSYRKIQLRTAKVNLATMALSTMAGSRGQIGAARSKGKTLAAELGTTFVCDPKLAHRQAAREEARDTQAVPVLQAKN